MNIQERFSLRKSAVGLVSVSLLCAIHTSTVAADTVVTGVNEIIEESQVKDEASIESEKNESLDGSNLEIVEEIADNIPSPVIAEGEIAVEMKVDGGTENVVSRNDTEVKTSEQNQIEVAETKEILNQTSYQTESGEQRQIIWAHGITPPAMEQSGGFVKEKYGDYLNYTAPFKAGKGYYDTNKSLNASFIDLNLCFAAVSSNMVHWWLEQNSSYVERYLKEKNSTVNVGENYAITDLRRYIDSFQDQQNSRVFDMFKTYYGYRTNGFVSDALVDLFINGYKPKVQGGVNLEDSQLVPDSRGGFFYDVFKEKKLTNRIFSGSYERFGEDVRTVLESKGLLGLTYRTLGYATHIVTVWGAEYDNQGKIRAVYITDSDDQQEQIGLKRMGITRDASGNPRLNNHVKNNSAGALLDYVHTIRLGQDLWEEYFNPLAKAKEIASQILADTKKALVLSIQGQSELSESGRVTYLEKLDRLYDQGVLAIQKAESSELLNVALEDSLKSLDFPMSAVGEALTAELPAGELPPNADENSQLSPEICSADGKEEKGDVALVVDSINQPVLPVDDQAILPVAVIGEPVNDEQLATNENQSQSTIALGEESQVEGSDLPVVVDQDAVKNDEVVPVEELLESETVENQRSELLSGPIGMEGVNVKEEDQVATTATEQPATSKTTTVQASFDEPASAESETVSQPAPISSPDRSDVPVQPEVTEVAVEVGETAIPPVALPETVSAPVVQASLDESAGVESESVAQPAPISSPGILDIPVQPEVTEVAVEVGETDIPPVALPETVSAPVVQASLDESAGVESESVAKTEATLVPVAEDIPALPGHSAIRVAESVATSSTISEKHKFVDGEVPSTLKVGSEGVANESNAPQVEFLTDATTESILAEADRSSILTETKVIQPNKLMNNLESKEKILVPKFKSLDSVKMDMSSQEIVLPEVPEREPQMSRREMDKGYKGTDLDESAEPKAIVESISQSSNNTRKYGQHQAVHSKIDTKQVLSVEQSSKTMTNVSGQIVGISLLTLLLGSVWGLLKKASKKQ
ncbi:YSIRK-type signal peptide-containing protein [Streptococcus suis]|uniref:IdeS/Mac family cysteine endopeptidase n=1 Tax=Streptococcus suis TaxID=1307 RepID=UPI0010A92420|nr:IdeS/Mac family cysteine endopeptidase [Streptococcus suis]QCE38529.1 YSIRK-type signal peptide-containing protein [Streptococcus suis]